MREWVGDREQSDARLALIGEHGVPNYFGPQRFGRGGGNLAMAEQLFAGKRMAREKRSLAISAGRSLLFNDVLSARIDAGTWNRILPGEAVNLDGSGSYFVADDIDDTLASRCASQDVHPTGPLYGAGDAVCGEDIESFERSICEARYDYAQGIIRQGAKTGRRALRTQVHELQWSQEKNELVVCFRLGRGCYATAVLRELMG